MNLTFSTATLVALLLASTRVLAWLVIAPPFATMGMPRSIRPMVAVALSLAVTPLAAHHVPPAEIGPLVGAGAVNVAVGAALGFGTRLIFTAVEAAGSLIDLFGGFSLAFALDPMSETNTSLFGRFYGLLTTVLIFVSQAHLLIIAGFMRSFDAIPLNGGVSFAKLDKALVPGMTNMFVAALQIAGPLIVVLFVADVAMGLLNRIAPQMNVFALSFPLKILLTLSLVGLGFALLPDTVARLAEQGVRFVGGVTG
ncbi:MAG TPA: flagellar biosynthetic protein FliR [Mycobacterium sp.]|nr:flagellar biosynthetic protein FliR [Mycobacterium sp.]